MKVKLNQIVGITCAVINLLWTIHFAHRFYLYHFTDIMFLSMYPDWILFVNMTIGIIGLYISLLLFRNRLKMNFFSIIKIIMLFVGLLILC